MNNYRKIRISLLKGIIAIAFIGVGIKDSNLMLILFGVVMLFVAFYKKELTYDKDGVYIRYSTIFKGVTEYKYDEMSKIQASFATDKSTIIIFRNGVKTFLKFDGDDVVKILEFAEKKDVYIEYVELKKKPMSV